MMIPQEVWDQATAALAEEARKKHHSHSTYSPTTTFAPSTSTYYPTHSSTHHVAPVPTVIPDLPKVYVQEASDVGHRTLWVVCVVMAIASLAFYAMAARVPTQKRLFHIITAFITTFAFLSYFAMATGDGHSWHTTVTKENHHHGAVQMVKREVYWARYVDWSLTTPLLLLDLCLLAGLSGANILVAVVADIIMVLTGMFAAFGSHEGQKWGWYAWACIAYLVIVYQLGYNGRVAVSGKDTKTKAFFGAISLFTLFLWTVYPIVWGIADGARMVNVDGEIIAYAVLDLLAKPVFGFWLLFTHDAMTRSTPSVEGFWAHGVQTDGALRVGDGRRVNDDD